MVSAMGGLLFGYDWVVIGGAKPFYERFFDIASSANLQAWAMSCALIGCILGAMISGVVSDKFGRKWPLLVSAFLFTIASIGTGMAGSYLMFVIFRMIGGVGIGLGIRSSDEKSVGIMPHLRTYDASSLAYRQGRTRRGSYAAYLDISHPDIIQFLEMRKPTGDQNMRCLNLHHGINITDDFMYLIEKCMLDPTADDSWQLKDPHSNEVRDTVSAKELWQRILEMRMMTGEPYLHFIDTSNRSMPQFQKDLGLSIRQSNLCVTGESEVTIRLPSGEIVDTQIETVGSYLNELGQCHIWGRDLTTGIDDFFPLIAWGMTNPSAEVMRITDEDTGYSITCTEDHQIYTTNRGWVKAGELAETDTLKFVGS